MNKLYAYLYTNNLTTPVFTMDLTPMADDIRLIWQIHGGLVSAEVSLGMSEVKAYDFYARYIGYRVVVLDNPLDKPVADAFITEIAITNTGVRLVCNGFWWRHYDQLYAFDETSKASGTVVKHDNDNTDSNLLFNPVANSFQDKETDFATYSVAGAPALYKITVTSTDGSVATGFIGDKFTTTNANDSVYVYKEDTLATAGWNGTVATADTYYVEIITSDLVYNPVANSFQDPAQDFSSFASAVAPSLYEISILNSDNTATWGFIGGAFTTTAADDSVYVYQDYALTTAGWNGELPGDKTPESYSVLLVYNYYSTSEIIEDALTNEVPAISTDYSHIDDALTPVGFWRPPLEEGGMYVGELIEKLASFSDSDNAQWNYWLENQPLNGTTPQKPVAYFAAQLDDGTFNYDIRKWMIPDRSDAATRNIQEVRNSVRVIYRDMADGETAIAPPLTPLTDADSITKYWLREVFVSGGDADEEMAELYAGLYLDKFKDALLGKPITITSPHIYDQYGNQVPLWHPIKNSRSYFRLSDLYPTQEMFSESWNRLTNGQAVEMEYSYSNNELRIFLDTESNELDALVARMDGFQ